MSYQDGRIEVGMLVEIVDDTSKTVPSQSDGEFLGHIGCVLRQRHNFKGCWDIEGAEYGSDGIPRSSRSRSLRPIPPDHTPAESEWQEDFRRMLNRTKEAV